jgi:hypothetical protein
MSVIRRFLFLLFGLSIVSGAYSQVTRSPFTTFGIGEPYTNALIYNQGMAGVGAAQPQNWYTASINPALLVYNNQVMFSAGIIAEQKKIISDTLTEKTKAGNLNYLTTAFPLMKLKKDARINVWTTSLSLFPFTTVRYNTQYTQPIDNSDQTILINERGTGGISRLTWANGFRITNELAFGMKASYYFGSIVNTYENFPGTNPAVSAAVEHKYYVKDFGFTGGLSFTRDSLFSRQKYRLSLGLVYDFNTDLRTRRREVLYSSRGGTVLESDTLTTRGGSLTIPGNLTAGIAVSRGRWNLGLDISYRDWSKFKSFEREDEENYGKSWRYALGGEITPDGFSDNFLKRITYRGGLSYEQTPYLVNTDNGMNSVKDVGVNLGVSIPTGRWSTIDFGVRYGRRGDKQETIFEEDYYRFFFGISFNDKDWFIRRKFD